MSPPQVPPPSAPLWPPASPPSSPDSVNAFHYTLGSLLALLSGILVAYSMGLEIKLDEQGAPPPTIRFWGRDIGARRICGKEIRGQDFIWCAGMIFYGIGSGGTCSIAGLLIPLSLLSAIFVTLLVFNLGFARLILSETPTRAKKMGAVVVLVGCTLCSLGSSGALAGREAPNEFDSYQMADYFSATAGAAWFIGLCTLVVGSVVAIAVFERRFPTEDLVVAHHRRTAAATPQPDLSDLELAPSWLESLMALVYPGSLGLDEAIVHLCLKGGNAMSTTCGRDERDGGSGCTHWVYPVTLSIWMLTAFATVGWLRVVFKRYETTVALPVEYGAAAAGDVVSGLVFYQE